MIYLNISYFDTVLGPETLCTVPSPPEEDIKECTNSLLNISEFIELKFFVYVSSKRFKTSNIYTKIPSEWARGKVEMLLISVILVDEDFTRLYLFEDVLEKMVEDINKIEDAYMAFYSRQKDRPEINKINAKKEELIQLLQRYLPEIDQIIENAKQIPLEGEIIETEENLQDEFVILRRDDPVIEAAKKMVSSPRIVIGCVIENKKPVGVLDEDDILKKVILQGKDPILMKVGDIMTKEVITIDANEPISEVIDLMIDNGIKAVPILQDEEFYGVFTISDAANHNKNIIELIGEHLQDLSEQQLENLKQLKVKLWSYLRNITRNRKLLSAQNA